MGVQRTPCRQHQDLVLDVGQSFSDGHHVWIYPLGRGGARLLVWAPGACRSFTRGFRVRSCVDVSRHRRRRRRRCFCCWGEGEGGGRWGAEGERKKKVKKKVHFLTKDDFDRKKESSVVVEDGSLSLAAHTWTVFVGVRRDDGVCGGCHDSPSGRSLALVRSRPILPSFRLRVTRLWRDWFAN